MENSPSPNPTTVPRSGAYLSGGTRMDLSDLRVFWISVAILFFELLAIRLIGTEVPLFAYLQNAILITCFLGMGLGCLASEVAFRARESVASLLLLVLLITIPVSRQALAKANLALDIASGTSAASADFSAWADFFAVLPLTFVILLLVLKVFVFLGQMLAKQMNSHPQLLRAYGLNLAGSLAGVWLFSVLGILCLPPVIWVCVGVVILVPLIWAFSLHRSSVLLMTAMTTLAAVFIGWRPDVLSVAWSPYQKLALLKTMEVYSPNAPSGGYLQVGQFIEVNNTTYQSMVDLRPASVEVRPDVYSPAQRGLSQYDIPYLLHGEARNALIVGSGSGNDVAGALRNGVKEVTAVDIDPLIVEWGKRWHPERPYSSQQVETVIDDARAFFRKSKSKYDIIVFGLLDSHAAGVATNTKLDHFVYTKESLGDAVLRLKETGIIAISFAFRRPYIMSRIAAALREVTGRAPYVIEIPSNGYGFGATLLLGGDQARIKKNLAGNERLNNLVSEWNAKYGLILDPVSKPLTDDWPYLYLTAPSVPPLFIVLSVMLVAIFLWERFSLGFKSYGAWRTEQVHFFCLGAGFLLLESWSVMRLSTLFGSVWQVSAIVISGVLAMSFLGNLVVMRRPDLNYHLSYLGLLTCVLMLMLFRPSQVQSLPFIIKAIGAGLLTATPLFFSGQVFSRSLKAATSVPAALSANLFGALFGGLLQCLAFRFGIHSLLWLVALLYLASWTVSFSRKWELQPTQR